MDQLNRTRHDAVRDLNCKGPDPRSPTCSCPDLAMRFTVRIKTGTTSDRKWLCACCDGAIDPENLPA